MRQVRKGLLSEPETLTVCGWQNSELLFERAAENWRASFSSENVNRCLKSHRMTSPFSNIVFARAFNAMQAEISQFDAERMRMLAAVGHDLRTPMTSLRIRAEMIDDDELRNAMVRTLDEMTVMADGLISYARDGQDAEKMTLIELAPLLRQLCEDRGATCHATGDVRVTGRRVSLGRAFGNLVDNALRYGEEATVTLSHDRRYAIVTIEDNGPGIPPARLNEMFQPFTRGDDSRSLETGGAGLGLSISRTIVVAHGGQITLGNRSEGGLRAKVLLPLAKQT